MNESTTQEYLQNLDRMTKLVLRADSETEILKIQEILQKNNIKHHTWIEQPENIISALATIPMQREILKPLLKGYKLFK